MSNMQKAIDAACEDFASKILELFREAIIGAVGGGFSEELKKERKGKPSRKRNPKNRKHPVIPTVVESLAAPPVRWLRCETCGHRTQDGAIADRCGEIVTFAPCVGVMTLDLDCDEIIAP